MNDDYDYPDEPTPEECSVHAMVSTPHGPAFACWYPQMGGYVGKAIAVLDDDGCFDVLVWHDGDFPFSGRNAWPGDAANPKLLHHCDPGQFIAFGEAMKAFLDHSSAE